jgi:hypothetical protein
MALIVSAATGNFSAGATWVGGVVPTVGDEARASTGHTVTIDVDTTCDEVSNAGTGIFTLASGVTLTANVTNKSATTSRNCLQFTAASPAEGFIVGNCTGGTVPGSVAAVNTFTGTLNITGNCQGGSVGGASFAYGASNLLNGTINITGNSQGSTSGAQSAGSNNASSGVINITGNATGGHSGNAFGTRNSSTGTIGILGISAGGTGAEGSRNILTGTINLTRAKGNTYGPGNTSGLAAVVGAANAGVGVIEIEELEYGEYGMNPTSGTGIRLKKVSTNAAIFNYVDAGSAKTLVDASTTGQMPAESDVRDGVSYASGALVGSCKVPAAASVGFGVPVDATTGTAALEPSDIAAAVWDRVLTGATHNIPSSAGRRLRILDDERIITDGQVQGAGTNTVTLEPITTLCIGQTVVVTDQATGNKQVRFILAFDSDTNTATVDTQWCDIPTAGDEYQLTTVRSPLIARNDYPSGTIGSEIDEMYLIHGLKDGEALTVTPTSRTAGAIAQTIGGDGTNTTTVSRD